MNKLIAIGFTIWCITLSLAFSAISSIQTTQKTTPGKICTLRTLNGNDSFKCTNIPDASVIPLIKEKANESGCRNGLGKNVIVIDCDNRI